VQDADLDAAFRRIRGQNGQGVRATAAVSALRVKRVMVLRFIKLLRWGWDGYLAASGLNIQADRRGVE
jgi:hypothetical protein